MSWDSDAAELDAFKAAFQQEIENAPVTCGGEIPFTPINKSSHTDGQDTDGKDVGSSSSAQPVGQSIKTISLRFGPNNSGKLVTLSQYSEGNETNIRELIEACKPASFGLGKASVIDETYREALVLDSTDFLTDFCPYKFGIVDIISQILLPWALPETDGRGIRAELDKLNIYSAPCGRFKSHVDTPKGESHIGSLVVVLPTKFEGGALSVSHAGKTFIHKWDLTSLKDRSTTEGLPAVQWAAFYSDCDHEIFPVTKGHRITLTYNLFVSAGTGLLAGRPIPLEPKRSSLYRFFKDKFHQLDWYLPNTGLLGVHLSHSYPHTNGKLLKLVPNMLKGADMVLYEALHAARIPCILEPITRNDNHFTVCRGLIPSLQNIKRRYDREHTSAGKNHTITSRLREIKSWVGCPDGSSEPEEDADGKIVWLNDDNFAELAVSRMYYGNYPVQETCYSSVAIIIFDHVNYESPISFYSSDEDEDQDFEPDSEDADDEESDKDDCGDEQEDMDDMDMDE